MRHSAVENNAALSERWTQLLNRSLLSVSCDFPFKNIYSAGLFLMGRQSLLKEARHLERRGMRKCSLANTQPALCYQEDTEKTCTVQQMRCLVLLTPTQLDLCSQASPLVFAQEAFGRLCCPHRGRYVGHRWGCMDPWCWFAKTFSTEGSVQLMTMHGYPPLSCGSALMVLIRIAVQLMRNPGAHLWVTSQHSMNGTWEQGYITYPIIRSSRNCPASHRVSFTGTSLVGALSLICSADSQQRELCARSSCQRALCARVCAHASKASIFLCLFAFATKWRHCITLCTLNWYSYIEWMFLHPEGRMRFCLFCPLLFLFLFFFPE